MINTIPAEGIERSNRTLLERLHRTARGPFGAAEAAPMLEVPEPRASRLLRYLAARGWLSRIRRGLYTVVPLGATNPSAWREDEWIIASRVFAPSYIAGWSALGHWSLTEQLFRTVMVATGQSVRARDVEVQGTSFRVRHVPKAKHFGLKPVWRGRVRVLVSDPSRTMVDVLDDPSSGGGMRHIADALGEYWVSDHRSEQKLIEYATRVGNRTVFKRLGFLAETMALDAPKLVEACRRNISSGVSALDPAVRRQGRIVTRWNLRVNVAITPREMK
jgi:predicted transcriptional regulator of viral defense system